MVVSVYNENLEWLDLEPYKSFDKIVYHKGEKAVPECKIDHCKIVKLPNVGRCDHTYLKHIIENYDNLKPVTLFVTGSCRSLTEKRELLDKVLIKMLETKTTIMYVTRGPPDPDFQIDYHKSGDINNRQRNIKSELQKSPIRPLKRWFEHNFPGEIIKYVHYKGTFAVSKEHIHNRTKEFYQKLIKYLEEDSNPEVGHYMERSWATIFQPLPEQCVYYN
jgi:hypothetical protein